MSESGAKVSAIVVGGSIGGLAAANALQRSGISVQVFDKAKQMRPAGAAIGLFANGFASLESIAPASAEKVKTSCVPVTSFTSRNQQGEQTESGPNPHGHSLTLFWKIQEALLSELAPECIHLSHAFQSYDVNESDGKVCVQFRRDGGEEHTVEADLLIGADGCNSAVRKALLGGDAVEQHFHGKIMFRATVAASSVKDSLMPPTGEEMRWKGDVAGMMFGWRETAPGLMTFTGAKSSDNSEVPADKAAQKQMTLDAFAEFPTEVQEIIQLADPEAFYVNAMKDNEFLETWTKGRTVLVGDAAHAMTAGLGMGANMALEDAAELGHFLCNPNVPLEQAVLMWEASRKERVRSVHQRSRARTEELRKGTVQASEDLMQFMADLYRYKPPPIGVTSMTMGA